MTDRDSRRSRTSTRDEESQLGDEQHDEAEGLDSEENGIEKPTSEVCDGVENRKNDSTSPPPETNRADMGKQEATGEKDPKLVTWDGSDDPENPKLWSMRRKWAAVFVGESAGHSLWAKLPVFE